MIQTETRPELPSALLGVCASGANRPGAKLLRWCNLHYREGTSDKVYYVLLCERGGDREVWVGWGRRFAVPTVSLKATFPTELGDKALAAYGKACQEKLSKGYRLVHEELVGSNSPDTRQATAVRPLREPQDLKPCCMLLTPAEPGEVDGMLSSGDNAIQLKVDGVRLQVTIAEAITARNRRGAPVPVPAEVEDSLRRIGLPAGVTLDGELTSDGEALFHIFDVVDEGMTFEERMECLTKALDRESMGLHGIRPLPRAWSSSPLTAVVNPTVVGAVRLVPAYRGSRLQELAGRIQGAGLEGIVIRSLDGLYTVGRSDTAWKHKFVQTATVAVHKVNAKRSVELLMASDRGYTLVGNVTIPVNHAIPKAGDIVEVRYLYANGDPEGEVSLYQPVYQGPRTDMDGPDFTGQLKFRSST